MLAIKLEVEEEGARREVEERVVERGEGGGAGGEGSRGGEVGVDRGEEVKALIFKDEGSTQKSIPPPPAMGEVKQASAAAPGPPMVL